MFLQSPVDARKILAENIIVVGGTSMLLGFKARLAEELRDLREKPRYKERLFVDAFKFHSPPGKENYVAWLGGQFGFGLLFTWPPCISCILTELCRFQRYLRKSLQ